MKKVILFISGILIFTLSFGQTNFKWEKTDSITKTKDQLYSDTKMFIAETWKSSKDVIQNDDKDGGIVLIKGASTQKIMHVMAEYVFVYSYNVTCKMKNGKYKMNLDNVHCESARITGGTTVVPKVEPFDGNICPSAYGGKGKFGDKVVLMMTSLKSELQGIVDSYEKYIKTTSTKSSEW